jgi:hypothetical protein
MTSLRQMAGRKLSLASCVIVAAALGACGHNPRPGVRPALVQPIGNARQVEDVVAALTLGDVKRARKLLKAMAKRDPSDRQVATLQEGLNGDPAKLLGTLFFSYRVEGDEQLTTLSKRFLGDRLKFYLLARYNGLTSDGLRPGQLIRIPGLAPAPKQRADPRLESRPDARPEPRGDQRPDPQLDARQPSPPPPAAPTTSPTAKRTAAGQLRAQALAALNRGAVENGVLMLRRARALDSANPNIKNDLARAERLLAAVKVRR